jgi:thiamine biosynthesis lipoprotein
VKKSIQTTFPALGTVNTISVSGFADEAVVYRAAERVRELHRRLSAFGGDSEISAVNAAAGKHYVRVHDDTYELVRKAKIYAGLTGGAFDPTVRPLVGLWNIGGQAPAVPDTGEICDALCLTSFKDILTDDRHKSIMLRRPRMAVDLGAIAKGYAADEVRRILLENGVTEAVVNLGGTVTVLGTARTVGIQHPDRKTGNPMGAVTLRDQAAVTSGSYEKYFMKDGRRCHHLIDPHTGYPADSGLKSVTLIGASALELDALSTAVFVLGAETGNRLVEKLGLQAVYVTSDDQIYVTAGLKDAVTLSDKVGGAI